MNPIHIILSLLLILILTIFANSLKRIFRPNLKPLNTRFGGRFQLSRYISGSEGNNENEAEYRLSIDGNHPIVMSRAEAAKKSENEGANSFSNNKKIMGSYDKRIGAGAEVEGLNRDIFTKILPLMCIKIPAKYCTNYLKQFKDMLYTRPRMKRIFSVNHTDGFSQSTNKEEEKKSDVRYLVLSDSYTAENVEESFPKDGENLRFLQEHGEGEIVPFNLKITYDNLNVDEVLKKLLPPTLEKPSYDETNNDYFGNNTANATNPTSASACSAVQKKLTERATEVPSSYEQVGHVAHLNLREELKPYSNIIGQVILDKHWPNIRTVINKVGTIENQFRTFPMEVIAGEDDLDVTVSESGCRFAFNFRDVYVRYITYCVGGHRHASGGRKNPIRS